MGITWDDVAREMALSDLHDEAVMVRATYEQCIFLFVEGESEEIAIPILFTDVVDLDLMGVRIANYNGHGNLLAALRLLKQTLSHNRPIVLTHDNDPASVASVRKCEKQDLLTDLTYQLPIPTEPVVRYPCGHRGGAFEESFPIEVFLNAAFSESILPMSVLSERSRFEATFDPTRPWLPQLRKFTANRGFVDWNTKKTDLANSLTSNCDGLPPTYSALGDLLRSVREEHPVIHPDDVELPKVYGLTHSPDMESLDRRV